MVARSQVTSKHVGTIGGFQSGDSADGLKRVLRAVQSCSYDAQSLEKGLRTERSDALKTDLLRLDQDIIGLFDKLDTFAELFDSVPGNVLEATRRLGQLLLDRADMYPKTLTERDKQGYEERLHYGHEAGDFRP